MSLNEKASLTLNLGEHFILGAYPQSFNYSCEYLNRTVVSQVAVSRLQIRLHIQVHEGSNSGVYWCRIHHYSTPQEPTELEVRLTVLPTRE